MGTHPHLELEKLVIAALCAGVSDGLVRDSLLPMFRDYSWQFPMHQVIFSALDSIPSSDPAILRQMLPAKLTRLGFPDVEWEEFFTPLSISSDEILALARRMVAGAQPS